ncbi:MAG: hypothetical protein AAB657_04595 [Patescibacteria group bacterium]
MNTESTSAIIYGVFLIILGLVYSREKFIRQILDLGNKLRSAPKEPDPTTIKLNRAIAWLMILLGAFWILMVFIR